ncbi:MAG: putative bifunctional diguanylate cyclase/phosphodiesterase [Roseobacter sp.]
MNATSNTSVETFARSVPGLACHYTLFSDGAERIDVLNDYAPQIWGLTAQEAAEDPATVWGLVHAGDVEELRRTLEYSAAQLTPWELQWRVFDPRGNKRWLTGRGTPEALPCGAIRWLIFVFDITARIEAETVAAEALDQLNVALEAIPDSFALFDAQERLVTCNNAFRHTYGRSKAALVKGADFESILRAGLAAGQFRVMPQDESNWLAGRLQNFRRAQVVEEVQLHDGTWLRVLERPTSTGGRVSMSNDITNAKRRQAELESAALTDALTGLLNRRGLGEKISGQHATVRDDERIAFLHVDLDKFKSVNDTLGHEAGDFVLTKVAGKLTELAPQNAKIARFGGDEFVLVLPCAPSEVDVFQIAEHIRSAISIPLKFKGRLCQVGATVGIAVWCPNANYAIEQAQLDADTALVQGKIQGRDRTIIFREEMRNRALEKAHLASQVKSGIKKKQFVPFFQPQIELPSGRLRGFEALARWQRHDGKATSASAFINVASETGLVADIDKTILEQSFDAFASLQAAGLNETTLSINLSHAMLRSANLADLLLSCATAHDIAPQFVHIEVLETALLDHVSETLKNNISRLSHTGFQIDLDGFGTGHTALAILREFPINRIKLAQSIVRSIDQDPTLKAISEGIHGLCSRMNIEAIAEGTETDAQIDMLKEVGFSLFQGYRIARPMPYDGLIDWLESRGDMSGDLNVRAMCNDRLKPTG